MSKKRLNSYSGKLTSEQIAEGMNIAQKNAIRLVEDAELLFTANKFPSACALSILSIEESGKNYIFRGLSTANTDEEIRNLWKDYHSHTKKNILWILFSLYAKGADKFEDLQSIFDPVSEHPYKLDQLKQISIYSDCLGNAHWSIPFDNINGKLAADLLFIAKHLTTYHQVTQKEIELWIKYFGKSDHSAKSQKKALSLWYFDMEKEGLLPAAYNRKHLLSWLNLDSDDVSSD